MFTLTSFLALTDMSPHKILTSPPESDRIVDSQFSLLIVLEWEYTAMR